MKKITIKSFGIIAEKMGSQQLEVQSFQDIASLKFWLESAYPELQHLNYSMALNRKLVHGNIIFTEDSELALLPPYSGG